MKKNNKNRARLALAELENELEVLNKQDLNACKAGGIGTQEDPYSYSEYNSLVNTSSFVEGWVRDYDGTLFYGLGETTVSSSGVTGLNNYNYEAPAPPRPEEDCYFRCMEYASRKYGVYGTSEYYERLYHESYGAGSGINAEHVNEFSSNFFELSYLNTNVPGVIENYVNNPNNTLIGTFNTYYDGASGVQVQHAVVIRFIKDNLVWYHDPQQGIDRVEDLGKFTSFYGINGTCR